MISKKMSDPVLFWHTANIIKCYRGWEMDNFFSDILLGGIVIFITLFLVIFSPVILPCWVIGRIRRLIGE